MATRITETMLKALVKDMNKVSDSPQESWVKQEDNSYRAQIGNYHLYFAYGKVGVNQMATPGGGVNTVFPLTTKRELETQIRAWLAGYNACLWPSRRIAQLQESSQ